MGASSQIASCSGTMLIDVSPYCKYMFTLIHDHYKLIISQLNWAATFCQSLYSSFSLYKSKRPAAVEHFNLSKVQKSERNNNTRKLKLRQAEWLKLNEVVGTDCICNVNHMFILFALVRLYLNVDRRKTTEFQFASERFGS